MKDILTKCTEHLERSWEARTAFRRTCQRRPVRHHREAHNASTVERVKDAGTGDGIITICEKALSETVEKFKRNDKQWIIVSRLHTHV